MFLLGGNLAKTRQLKKHWYSQPGVNQQAPHVGWMMCGETTHFDSTLVPWLTTPTMVIVLTIQMHLSSNHLPTDLPL